MNQSATLTALENLATDARTEATTSLLAYQQIMAQAARIPIQRDGVQEAYMQNLWPRPEEIAEHIFQQPHKAKADTVPLQLLLQAGGVIYGSRGLHVENRYSDYDFAFSYEEHRRLFHILTNSDIATSIPTEYFSSVPEAGYRAFFQYERIDPVSNAEVKVDVIFVHNDEDLDVIRSSVQDLQSVPQYMLRDKKFRIDAYNKALQHRGWKVAPDRRSQIRGTRPTVVRRDSRVDSVTRGFSPWI